MNENFGDRLKFIRTDRNFSPAQLAEKTGLTEAKINRIERRGLRPNLATVLKLAAALDVQPSLLLGKLA